MAQSNFYVTDGHDKLYRDTVSKLRSDLGRKVTVTTAGENTDCPNCLRSPVTGKSAMIYSPASPYPTNVTVGPTPFPQGTVCPVCDGRGTYVQNIEKSILCHVRWRTGTETVNSSAGWIEGSECRLQADVKHQKDFKNAMKVVVDDQDMEIMKYYPRGLKKLVQVIVFLKRGERLKPGSKRQTNYGGPI